MYRRGERIDPCLRPAFRWKGSDVVFPIFMKSIASVYVFMMAWRSRLCIPMFSSISHNLFLLTLLYALFISMEADNTDLSCE